MTAPDSTKGGSLSQRVTICGPNLRDQSKGSLHVHAAGCADLRKHARREPAYVNGWTIEANSRINVVTDVYPPDQFDYNPEDPGDVAIYETEFYFFPCVHLS